MPRNVDWRVHGLFVFSGLVMGALQLLMPGVPWDVKLLVAGGEALGVYAVLLLGYYVQGRFLAKL